MKLVTQSKSVESVAVTTANKRNMSYSVAIDQEPETIYVDFKRHGRGHERQADFAVHVTFADVVALIDNFAVNGNTNARLLRDSAAVLEALGRIEAEILRLKLDTLHAPVVDAK